MRPGFVQRSLGFFMFALVLGFYLGLPACGSEDHQESADSVSKTVSWTAEPDPSVLGYKLYWGTISHQYDSHADVGRNDTYTVSGLRRGTTYFFAVSAYGVGGESDLSAEVSSDVQ
ncbi:MAG TPA: fibronectin type III domain-containing protein [Nitrospira sp.]|jgi:Fibronectin type III domain|nr:fibronectin type III domain-containing protein [Nitrospira sp.]